MFILIELRTISNLFGNRGRRPLTCQEMFTMDDKTIIKNRGNLENSGILPHDNRTYHLSAERLRDLARAREFVRTEEDDKLIENKLILLRAPNSKRRVRALIEEGLELIKANKFREAIYHFQNTNAWYVAQCSGLKLYNHPKKVYFDVTNLSDVHRVADDIAGDNCRHMDNPGFSFSGSPRVGLKELEFALVDAELNNERDDLEVALAKEVALLCAEEWAHALQEAENGMLTNIGKYFAQNPSYNREIDVAIYFIGRGVDLRDTAWIKRYNREICRGLMDGN